MACIWSERDDGWQMQAISELHLAGVSFWEIGSGADRNVLLMTRPGVWVRINGEPVLGGLRVLEHKDELLIAGQRLYYSAETTPTITTYQVPEGGRPATCPICRGPIRTGQHTVRCPGCGRWFHQLEANGEQPAKPCWTYAPTCRFCSHPTAFEAEAAWRPEKEEAFDVIHH
jgi:hypothetical protein